MMLKCIKSKTTGEITHELVSATDVQKKNCQVLKGSGMPPIYACASNPTARYSMGGVSSNDKRCEYAWNFDR